MKTLHTIRHYLNAYKLNRKHILMAHKSTQVRYLDNTGSRFQSVISLFLTLNKFSHNHKERASERRRLAGWHS